MNLTNEYINLLRNIVLKTKASDFSKARAIGEFRGPLAQLVWQFVRFNEDYRRGFALVNKGKLDEEYFCWKFGISEEIDPDLFQLPVSVYFKNSSAVYVKPGRIDLKKRNTFLDSVFELVKLHMHNQSPLLSEGPVLAVINPLKDPGTIVRDLDLHLQNHWPISRSIGRKAINKGSSLDVEDLVKRIVCYIGRELDRAEAKDIDANLGKILGHKWNRKSVLQSKEIKMRTEKFKNLSISAPWSFFNQSIR